MRYVYFMKYSTGTGVEKTYSFTNEESRDHAIKLVAERGLTFEIWEKPVFELGESVYPEKDD